ncbi:MAG TPA: MFS transporter [Burkholderiaceae bacterium]|nr:MFS transporter [Burkholderiaceae bacterium]
MNTPRFSTATSSPRAQRREWLGLAVIALPCMLYAMDLTVLNLALPRLSADLKPTSAELLWIVDIYGFFVAAALITMGTLGDRIGRRRLLMVGAAAFGAASAIAALATTPAQLIASRALLGLAGATVAPSTLSLIRHMFHDEAQRTLAIAVWATSYSVGAAVGPLLGGIILEHYSWQAVFLMAVPVMVVVLLAAPLVLPEYRDPHAGRLDIVSAVLSLVAVLSAIYGCKSIAQDGLSVLAVSAIGVGVAVGAVCVRRQRTLAHPMIDLALFKLRAFRTAVFINILACVAIFGAFILLAQYLQAVLGLTPAVAGMWTVPSAVAFVLGSMTTPWVAQRNSRRAVIVVSLLIAAGGCMAISIIDASRAFGPFIGAWFAFAFGIAPLFTLTTDMIVGAAPPEQAGAASAISETGSEFGGALGIALLGSLATAVYRGEISDVASTLIGVPITAMQVARDTVGGAIAAASQLPAPLGDALLHTARAAYTHAMHAAFTISAAALLLTAVFAFVQIRTPDVGRTHTPS